MDTDTRSLVTGKVCPACNTLYGPDEVRCTDDNSLLAVVKRDPFIGRVIAEKYEIKEILGMGGFSTVYRAEQTALRRFVAVKILHAEFVDKLDKIRRFQHEAESISTLVHSNVATVYDYGVLPEGQPYLVMEWAPGRTLSSLLSEHKKLDAERAVAIFLQACEGIAAAHSKGLIHRDIKPSNIVLNILDDGTEHVKILDFGLAKVISDDEENREHLTMTGEVLGTPAYMAPEQCKGTATDQRTDIYSFGCVMYEVLSGTLPLTGDSSYDVMNKHVTEAPAKLSSIGDQSIPPRLVRIVTKTLQKDPDDRYQTIEELKDALLGVEPPISKEIKAIMFSGSSQKLSKKKLRLRRRLRLISFSASLLFLSTGGLLTYEQFKNMELANLEKKYANKVATFDCGTVSFEYPEIFVATDNAKELVSVKKFVDRLGSQGFFELKFLRLKKAPLDVARIQEETHKKYVGFLELKPVQEMNFGRFNKIRGMSTQFVCHGIDGMRSERHVYWGEPNAVWKFKSSFPLTKEKKYDHLHDTILDTMRYNPETKCTIPLRHNGEVNSWGDAMHQRPDQTETD